MRTIAISDIHGFSSTFRSLIDRVGLLKDDQLIILGDCIDRGPDSKGVLDIIIKLQTDGYKVNCIMGNHEEMLLKAHYSPSQSDHWFLNGGDVTLKSFGVKQAKDIPPKYISFFESLDYEYQTSNAIFVHAGLNMLNENPFQDEYSKLWIFNWYDQINFNWLKHRKIIHGHVFRSQYEIEKSLENIDEFPVMSIDNGCFVNKSGFGQLCALDLTNRKLYFNRNIG
jgi:serine/threonine protein phosphatase 1